MSQRKMNSFQKLGPSPTGWYTCDSPLGEPAVWRHATPKEAANFSAPLDVCTPTLFGYDQKAFLRRQYK